MVSAPSPPPAKLSTAALLGMVAAVGVIFVVMFGYILFLTPWTLDGKLWWTGFVSFVFALIAYLVYAGTDARPIRLLAGGLFVIGAGCYYGAILIAADPHMLVWLVLFSVVVVLILAAVFVMARQGERTQARLAQRRLTP